MRITPSCLRPSPCRCRRSSVTPADHQKSLAAFDAQLSGPGAAATAIPVGPLSRVWWEEPSPFRGRRRRSSSGWPTRFTLSRSPLAEPLPVLQQGPFGNAAAALPDGLAQWARGERRHRGLMGERRAEWRAWRNGRGVRDRAGAGRLAPPRIAVELHLERGTRGPSARSGLGGGGLL